MAVAQDLFIAGPIGRLAVRTKGLEARPTQVVVMVQGSNLSGQAMFDFAVAGHPELSLMDAMVARGLGAVTFALRGYGRSDRPDDGFSVTTETAMEDFDAVIAWVAAQGWPRPHVLAFSWGGRIAGRWAESQGARIGRLVLYDPARGGGGLVLPAPTDPWWVNTYEQYSEKLEPQFTAPEIGAALGAYALEHEPRSPNGIRRENATPVTAIEPSRITNPTLLVYGVEAAKASYMQGGMSRAEFFERLASDDKAFVILPGGGDFVHFQRGRRRLHKVIGEFLHAEPVD